MLRITNQLVWILFCVFFSSIVYAGTPVWTFTPLTPTTVAVPANGTALVQYWVTNQSNRTHTLAMQPIPGITQLTTGLNVCGNPFVLLGKHSCILSLQVNGSQLPGPISDGPIVCQHGSTNECYRPSAADILQITKVTPLPNAVITVTGSPLTLSVNSVAGQLTITNTSTQITALNITSNFTGTALQGNVTETGNTCAVVAPGASCTLTFTPGNNVVPLTNFPIQGSNTNIVFAAIAINSGSTLTSVSPNSGTASGETGVTLTGTGLLGATSVTFGGVAATSVNVINSTTVTAVTPAHTIGTVDVSIATPAGGATLVNGYTYVTTAIGQSSGGGIIACLGGGLNDLIMSVTDVGGGSLWAPASSVTGATSTTDGKSNTDLIVAAFGVSSSLTAAGRCDDYQIDSQGNTPCEAGNTCYNDWFLPAVDDMSANGQLNCLATNHAALGISGIRWSSTEFTATDAFLIALTSGMVGAFPKSEPHLVRCVRSFTP